jgi:hypothetical protein
VSPSPGSGAYGLRLSGALERRYLIDLSDEIAWVSLSTRRQTGHTDPFEDFADESCARINLLNGYWADLRRDPAEAVFGTPSSEDDGTFTHPFLGAAAAIFAHWHGLEAYHGGAIVWDGAAIMLLGEKGAGKSTSMAWFASQGVPVLSDDLVVIRHGHVLTGPRCLDLRRQTTDALRLGARTEPVRGERDRLALAAAPASAPLRGFVVLTEGDAELRDLRPTDRLRILQAFRSVSAPGHSSPGMLDVALLPAVELRRPLSLDGLPRLVDAVSALD